MAWVVGFVNFRFEINAWGPGGVDGEILSGDG